MTSQLCICIYIIGPEDGIEQLDQVLGCLNDELEGMAPRPASHGLTGLSKQTKVGSTFGPPYLSVLFHMSLYPLEH